jgi:hypothetical protein
MPMCAAYPASPSAKPQMRAAAPCHDERKEISRLLATAYLRLLRQRDHKSRIQATLDQKTPVLLSCYRVPPE